MCKRRVAAVGFAKITTLIKANSATEAFQGLYFRIAILKKSPGQLLLKECTEEYSLSTVKRSYKQSLNVMFLEWVTL